MRELQDFARATSTPLGYFFLPQPPEERLPIPHFRTFDDESTFRPSPDLFDTILAMERRQAWMREYLVEEGQQRLPFVHSTKTADPPSEVAWGMRQSLGLVDGWASQEPTWISALRMLQKRMEEIGILVVVNSVVGNNTHRPLDVSEFRGFVLADDYAPLVFVNGSDGKAAQMFTLAHELAHVWFGSSAAFDLRELQPSADRTEEACNKVAAEFLVPEDHMRQFWPRVARDPQRFQLAARWFKVSEIVAARRALDLRLIAIKDFLTFYHSSLDKEKHTDQPRGGGDFYLTQNLRVGRRFAESVIHATREGRLLYREAYHLTGLYGKAFEKYAALLERGGRS